ncbi:cuticle protein 14-like [Stegodyphus dumicola]|uniref:cuticle protein 14-like n=1 Tax=Stegodyphus dumicola TaxID=202533 RepID=UPI0015AE0970|nr:cuticle protein 14-like [Stegodyphus dumicola]
MKILILCALIAASQAAVLLNHGLIGTGASAQYRSQDGLGNYAFGYNEGHGSGATFRKETGSHGVVAGSYGLTVADGRQRIVNYVADAAGFRADIKTNEPGVEPKDPAHAAINKAGIIAPALTYAAPAAVHVAAGHPFGAYSYNTLVGHHGIGHHGLWW